MFLQFHQAQQEKAQRAHQEATELQQFLLSQMAEREEKKAMEKKEEMEDNMRNRQFMEVNVSDSVYTMYMYMHLMVSTLHHLNVQCHVYICVPQVEQGQFQEYAANVISEARARGAPVQPLVQAAQAGAGGGKGPPVSGKAGVRPSYKVRH